MQHFYSTLKFRYLIADRTVLGAPEALRLPKYALSPILEHLMQSAKLMGTVYVAYVPPGHGKTSACEFFMRELRRLGVSGLAICPGSDAGYSMQMARLLKVGPETGRMESLMEALKKKNADGDNVQTYLLLDEYMSHGPNTTDLDFALRMKHKISNGNVTVVILTRRKDSANAILNENALVGIQPLPGTFSNMVSTDPAVANWNGVKFDAVRLWVSVSCDPQFRNVTQNEVAAIIQSIGGDDSNPADVKNRLFLLDKRRQ
jgi:hypothetical protein